MTVSFSRFNQAIVDLDQAVGLKTGEAWLSRSDEQRILSIQRAHLKRVANCLHLVRDYTRNELAFLNERDHTLYDALYMGVTLHG